MFYALVARGQVPLAEMQMKGNDGNFPTVTRVLLGKIATTPDSKMSYQYDECVPACALCVRRKEGGSHSA